MANKALDIKNILDEEKQDELAKLAMNLYQGLLTVGRHNSDEKYWEGSWYGNDTIWRTIADINKIAFYADKNGIIKKDIQRRSFIVADMIVSGEKEGPMLPKPVNSGIIAVGEDSLDFDKVICSLMGFNWRDIPTLSNVIRSENNKLTSTTVKSNIDIWNNKEPDAIRENYPLMFQPTNGWAELLGHRYYDKMFESLRQIEGVYIFGAGRIGKNTEKLLRIEGVDVIGFCDNDSAKWGNIICNDIYCYPLSEIKKNASFIISVSEKYLYEVETQILQNGGRVVGVINFES